MCRGDLALKPHLTARREIEEQLAERMSALCKHPERAACPECFHYLDCHGSTGCRLCGPCTHVPRRCECGRIIAPERQRGA